MWVGFAEIVPSLDWDRERGRPTNRALADDGRNLLDYATMECAASNFTVNVEFLDMVDQPRLVEALFWGWGGRGGGGFRVIPHRPNIKRPLVICNVGENAKSGIRQIVKWKTHKNLAFPSCRRLLKRRKGTGRTHSVITPVGWVRGNTGAFLVEVGMCIFALTTNCT